MTGGGNTESSTSGCESSSTDRIGTDVALIPRWTATNCRNSDRSRDETGMTWCVSPAGSRIMQQHDARTWMNHFRVCSQDGGQRRHRGIYYDPASCGNGPSAGGKRRLIWEEGFASLVSSHVRPRDPGGDSTDCFPTTDDN